MASEIGPSLIPKRDRAAPDDVEASAVYADEAASWDDLHAAYETKRISHSVSFSGDGACTNQAESYFSRLRRAEWGQHHHISGRYLYVYAGEMAWREDHRRVTNGEMFRAVIAATATIMVAGESARGGVDRSQFANSGGDDAEALQHYAFTNFRYAGSRPSLRAFAS